MSEKPFNFVPGATAMPKQLDDMVEPLPGEDNWPQETVLAEAARLTSGDRQRDYDHPLPNHQRIASLWNSYLACRKAPSSALTPEDVAYMMILLKIARDQFTPKRDNVTDIAGYARCVERMRAKGGMEGYAL